MRGSTLTGCHRSRMRFYSSAFFRSPFRTRGSNLPINSRSRVFSTILRGSSTASPHELDLKFRFRHWWWFIVSVDDILARTSPVYPDVWCIRKFLASLSFFYCYFCGYICRICASNRRCKRCCERLRAPSDYFGSKNFTSYRSSRGYIFRTPIYLRNTLWRFSISRSTISHRIVLLNKFKSLFFCF